jgi:hypothetical protein
MLKVMDVVVGLKLAYDDDTETADQAQARLNAALEQVRGAREVESQVLDDDADEDDGMTDIWNVIFP